uniref:Uncharacterized protein n=1 Tax=Nelumbo nucifera TaxID=4432 RepID=A0A822Y7R2_NELNU|nr:TPA_asm: hypothetical protein HUJ06_030008 [Nelumbo nucifera]
MVGRISFNLCISRSQVLSFLDYLFLQTFFFLVQTGKLKRNKRNFVGVGRVEAKVGANKLELLPKEFSTVIYVVGFLSASQEKRLAQEIANLERDMGCKLRILAQNYP